MCLRHKCIKDIHTFRMHTDFQEDLQQSQYLIYISACLDLSWCIEIRYCALKLAKVLSKLQSKHGLKLVIGIWLCLLG